MLHEVRIWTALIFAALAFSALGCARQRPGSVAQRTTVVRISGFNFAPAHITVSARDSIVWVNDDGFAHTSTADSGAWSSPEFAKGARFSIMAPAPGRYAYHCAAHPSMTAVLEVRQPK
jgi:plastocyanin